MNIDALLEDYMNNPKWAGKIFMQDEKTCYMDGLIAGAKEMQKENGLLKRKVKNVRERLSDFLSEYEVGNYDNNTHQFYKDVYYIHNELMELAEMTEEEKIQEEILQEQWQEEQERELLYEEMRIQNYDFDYGDVKY